MTLTSDAKFVIGVLLATCIVIGAGAWITNTKTKPAQARVIPPALIDRLVRSDSPVSGPADAKVTVVEFADFQCPACGVLHPALKQVMDSQKNSSVRFVFRNYPLPQHSFAPLAAEAGLFAQSQNKFWEYGDILFAHQEQLSQTDLVKYGTDLGFNQNDFEKALSNRTFKSIVDRDLADGNALTLDHTPTVFINGTEYIGKYTTEELNSAITAALAK